MKEGLSRVLRIRSYAVQKHAIRRLNGQEVLVGDLALPVGRSYRDSLEEIIRR